MYTFDSIGKEDRKLSDRIRIVLDDLRQVESLKYEDTHIADDKLTSIADILDQRATDLGHPTQE